MASKQRSHPKTPSKIRARAGAGPKSWRSSIGKGTNNWSSTRRRKMGRRKRAL